MLINLFQTVRSAGVPCTLRELLDLLGALEKQLAYSNIDDFYYLSRAILVKDEKHYDKFDKAFDIYFKGIEKLEDIFQALIPEDWLRKAFEKELDPEELKKIQELNQDFTKAKLEIADNVLRQQMNLKSLEDLRGAFGIEEKKLAEKYGQDAVIDLATGIVTKKPQAVEAEPIK